MWWLRQVMVSLLLIEWLFGVNVLTAADGPPQVWGNEFQPKVKNLRNEGVWSVEQNVSSVSPVLLYHKQVASNVVRADGDSVVSELADVELVDVSLNIIAADQNVKDTKLVRLINRNKMQSVSTKLALPVAGKDELHYGATFEVPEMLQDSEGYDSEHSADWYKEGVEEPLYEHSAEWYGESEEELRYKEGEEEFRYDHSGEEEFRYDHSGEAEEELQLGEESPRSFQEYMDSVMVAPVSSPYVKGNSVGVDYTSFQKNSPYWGEQGRLHSSMGSVMPADNRCSKEAVASYPRSCGEVSMSAQFYGSSHDLKVRSCTADGHFVFAVYRTSSKPEIDPGSLYVSSNSSCAPVVCTPDFAIFKLPLTGCGTHKFVIGQTSVYLADVFGRFAKNSQMYGQILRHAPYRYQVECRYSKGSTASAGYMVVNTPTVPSIVSSGTMEVALRIAKDDSYTTFFPETQVPLRLLLGSQIYLDVKISHPPSRDVVLLVHYCIAYPRSSENVWVLVYNGCPNPLDYGTTLHLQDHDQQAVPKHSRRFAITTFQFLDAKKENLLDEEVRKPTGQNTSACTADGHFVFAVYRTANKPEVDPATLVVSGNKSCLPVICTPEFAIFKFPVAGCGTYIFLRPPSPPNSGFPKLWQLVSFIEHLEVLQVLHDFLLAAFPGVAAGLQRRAQLFSVRPMAVATDPSRIEPPCSKSVAL
ncbi:ZP4 protein, partial [Polypterus senegalus]